MKLKKTALFLAAVLLSVALAACAPAKAVTVGSFDDARYSNDFFNLTFQAPDGWSIASQEEIKQLFNAGAEALATDKESEEKMKLAEQQTIYLAFVSKYPSDYVEGTNPNFNVVCENLKLAGLLLKNSKDYAERALENFASSVEGYTFGDITTKTIGGSEFAVFDATLDYQGFIIQQRMYCTMKNNYAIAFTLTWFDEAELAELEGVIDSISFK